MAALKGASKPKSENSSSVFNAIGKPLVPAAVLNIALFTFNNPALEQIQVPFVGGVIAEAGTRSTFLKDAKENKENIGGFEVDKNYSDEDLVEFLSTELGSTWLHKQNIRRPVHILADFDYATLNLVLDNRVDNKDGPRVHASHTNSRDSGTARMWRRNSNARDWREWVATSLITEMALGPEVSDQLRQISDDKLEIDYLNRPDNPSLLPQAHLQDKTAEQFGPGTSLRALTNLVEGYTLIHHIEGFIKEIFQVNPYRELPSHQIGSVQDPMLFDIVYRLEQLVIHHFATDDASKEKLLGLLAKKKNLIRAVGGKKTIQPFLKFKPEHSIGLTELLFDLHNPADQQGFVKSVIEMSRHMSDYLKSGNFIHRTSSAAEDSFNIHHGGLSSYNILTKDGSFQQKYLYDIGDDIYSKAFKIRKRLLNAVFLDRESYRKLHIKKLISTQGKEVTGEKQLDDQDDIARVMSRAIHIDQKNMLTISPYLTGDYVSNMSGDGINHFMTMVDIFDLKKPIIMQIFDLKARNQTSDAGLALPHLQKFTFDHGPDSLRSIMLSLQKQICPINNTDSLDYKRGLLLLDHRNIVAHLTHGKVGQLITNAALEKVHRVAELNDGSFVPIDYSVKIISDISASGLIAHQELQTASWDIFGNLTESTREALSFSSLEANDHNSLNTGLYSAFTNDEKQIPEDMDHLLNSTFAQALDSEDRREYIFWCILLQLSDVASITDPTIPWYMQREVAMEQMGEGPGKLPGIADALFNEYTARLRDSKFTGASGNNVENFFTAAEKTSPASFSSVPLSEKVEVNNFLIESLKAKSFHTRAGGPLAGAFEEIVDLHGRINQLPNEMDAALERYTDVIFNIIDRVSYGNDVTGAAYAQRAADFFQNKPSDRSDSWSLVIQDFVGTHSARVDTREGGYRRQSATSQQSSSRDMDLRTRRSARTGRRTPLWSTDENGNVENISGVVSGGHKEFAGFAGARVAEADGISDTFKNAALENLRKSILSFNRNTNVLIMLAENICSQLFFGNTDAAQPRYSNFDQQYLSNFQNNTRGLLSYLGLVKDDGDIGLTSAELFDTVWEFCVIADQIVQYMPSVNLKLRFTKAAYRENANVPAMVSREFDELDDVYNLTPVNSAHNALNTATAAAERLLEEYLPARVFEATDETKALSEARAALRARLGANSAAEAQQRKEGLVDSVFDMVSRAAMYFHRAEKETAKEPQFELLISKKSGDPINAYEMLSKDLRLGFLDHVTIESQFAKHAIPFMRPLTPQNYAAQIPMKDALRRHVGLKTAEVFTKAARNMVTNNLKITMIDTDGTDHALIPGQSTRGIVKYHDPNVNTNRSFESLKIVPSTLFGFAYKPIELPDSNVHIGVSRPTNLPVVPRTRAQHIQTNYGNVLLNQFEGNSSRHSGRSQPLSAQETMTSGLGFDNLNRHYSEHLGKTPPKIYRKMLSKIKDMSRVIEHIKGLTELGDFNQGIENTHNPAFTIVPLEVPRAREQKKIVIEITVKKNTYQFAKAFVADPAAPLGWDGQIREPIRAVKPYNYEYGSSMSPLTLWHSLGEVLTTFMEGSDLETITERINRTGDPVDRSVSPSFRLPPKIDSSLNSFGTYIANTMSPSLTPLSGEPIAGIPSATRFAWQFDLFCKVFTQSNPFNSAGSASDTFTQTTSGTLDRFTDEGVAYSNLVDESLFPNHVQIASDGIRPGVDFDKVFGQIGAYVWNKNLNHGYSGDLQAWLEPFDLPRPSDHNVNWSHHWHWISTTPPTIMRSTVNYLPNDTLSYRYLTSQTPQTAQQAVFISPLGGYRYRKREDISRGTNSAIENANTFNWEYPEFHYTNRVRKVDEGNPKIKVELYLAKSGDQWTHFSTEPIFTDEINHPTCRELSELLSGQSGTSYRAIMLRPSALAGLQYKFNNKNPRYLGPVVPNAPVDPLEEYYTNDNIPFLPMFDFSRWLKEAVDSIGDADAQNQIHQSSISTEDFLEITRHEMDAYFRAKMNEVTEATQPYAVNYLNEFRNAVELYIGAHSGLSNAQKDWLRKVIARMPYIYDWNVQYPALDLKIVLQDSQVVEPPDIYLDFNWEYAKTRSESVVDESYNDSFRSSRVSALYDLEKQYLDFTHAMIDYSDLTSDGFKSSMALYENAIDKLLTTTDNFDTSKRMIQSTNLDVKQAVRKFVDGNGLMGVTPDVLANIDSIYRLVLERTIDSPDPRGKAKGLELLPNSISQVPLKLSPFDIRPPSQVIDQRPKGRVPQGDPLQHWKNEEAMLKLPNGDSAFEDAATRVCFIGIEAGELQKILGAPSEDYGSTNQGIIDRRNDSLTFHDLESGQVTKFQIKLELFDFFRPWLRFEYNHKINVSRSKVYRVLEPYESSDDVAVSTHDLDNNNIYSPMINNLMTQTRYHRPENDELNAFSESSYKFKKAENQYDVIDVFLKTYAHKVLGLDFFEFMIPRKGTTPPISDYTNDAYNAEGALPEERGYQEYLNEYAFKVINDIRQADVGSSDLSNSNHLLKYFLERKNLSSVRQAVASNLPGAGEIRHYDSVGRVTLIGGNNQSFGLLDSSAVDLSDSNHPRIYPFRLTNPITTQSLVAAEVITAVNEYTDNVLREFESGFAFDKVVGIPYKLSNFKLVNRVRTRLAGEQIDISQVQAYINDNVFTDAFYDTLLKEIPYLDKGKGDGTVKDNALYPLTLRASVCRIEEG